ncbi:MAG: hypothetical protein G01um101429_409 [Parcubacteria group bacterium Gr01-1014_29]|nr:MAG: hypothetical protein G01um101429_409 [Parcubacteria group bacterium Gr01-1014_29]
MHSVIYKKFYRTFVLLLVLGGFVVLFTVPVSSSSLADSAHAVTLESIQQQLNEIFAVLKRISDRIAILLQEAQGKKTPVSTETQIADTVLPPAEPVEVSIVPTVVPVASVSEPVWKFIEVPSRSFAGGLIILYRYSITAGDKDFTVFSARFHVAFGDVSVKDLEVHAFKDEYFSTRAYKIGSAYNNMLYVGRRKGFLESGKQDVDISFENGVSAGLLIPARETRYFELRGFTSGKNTTAYLEVSGEGLSKVVFE